MNKYPQHLIKFTFRLGKFPFVTREEFDKLQEEFLDVKETLHSMKKLEGLQDQKLLEAMSKATTSIIDPMAALQLSASLETTEEKIDALSNMLSSIAEQFPGSIDAAQLVSY